MRQTDRQAGRQTDRRTGRQTDRQTDRQAGRQADRQRNGLIRALYSASVMTCSVVYIRHYFTKSLILETGNPAVAVSVTVYVKCIRAIATRSVESRVCVTRFVHRHSQCKVQFMQVYITRYSFRTWTVM